ncbi:MAG TPA: hypothetical protein DEA08_27765, partial [Planctomycetes bacterium]|nr:hypothetical protein [Planctomycetota bacterium]
PAGEAGVLLRQARDADERRHEEFEARRPADVAQAQDVCGEGLRIVGAERLLDGERLILYYASQQRVDVPDLLADLRAAFGVAVTLTQVGARQRAAVVGGCGSCGRAFCCSTFLRKLSPVPIRLARVQGLDLDPDRTAGRCGRLKCCLRYENPHYEELRAGQPRVGWSVVTRRLSGTVLSVDVLRGKLLIKPEGSRARVVFNAEVLEATPPAQPRVLPRAGEPAPAQAPEPEVEVAGEGAPEPRWSTVVRRLNAAWQRFREKPPASADPAPSAEDAQADAVEPPGEDEA